MTADRQELGSEPIRIDLRRSVKALLLTLVLPVTAAVAVDLTSGTLPFLTIAAAIICIPLATIVVSRTVLAEFNRVVALVAPPEQDKSQAPVEAVDTLADSTENGATEGTVNSTADGASTGTISNDWPLDGQPFTEGAQKHHG